MTLKGGCVVDGCAADVRDAVVVFGITAGTSRFPSSPSGLASASGSMTPKGFCLGSAAVVVGALPGPTRMRESMTREVDEVDDDVAGVVTGVRS